MTYTTERMQGPILYQTTDDYYKFSSTEINCINKTTAFTEDQVLKLPDLQGLKEYIQLHVDRYKEDVLRATDDVQFYVSQSWVSKYNAGDGQVHNMHMNSVLTGCIDVTEGEGESIFYADGRNEVFPGLEFPYNAIPFSVSEYRQGKVTLWPSRIPYTVPPNKLSTEVVKVWFNVYVYGTLGIGGINAPFNTHSRVTIQKPND